MINVMYALEPDYRKRLWPVLAAPAGTRWSAGLHLARWWSADAPSSPGARFAVGRHTYTVQSEILESDGEAFRARYLYRVTEGEKVISEEEIIGYAYRPRMGRDPA